MCRYAAKKGPLLKQVDNLLINGDARRLGCSFSIHVVSESLYAYVDGLNVRSNVASAINSVRLNNDYFILLNMTQNKPIVIAYSVMFVNIFFPGIFIMACINNLTRF